MDSIGTALVIVAHPDDAELFAGGTIARWADEGWAVLYVIATPGDKGSFELDREAVARVREEEARRAAEMVGVKEVILLGYADGELGALPPGVLRERFMRLIRQLKPNVLMTWDPFAPYETHPDHRAVGMAATEATEFAALPLYHPEHLASGIQPHHVTEKYFFAKHPIDVNRVVEISPYIERKLAALACHASQMEFLVEDVLRQLQAAGLEAEALELSESDRAGSVAGFVRGWAREAGAQAGVEYGEAFRYVRCSPFVEQWIQARSKESLP